MNISFFVTISGQGSHEDREYRVEGAKVPVLPVASTSISQKKVPVKSREN